MIVLPCQLLNLPEALAPRQTPIWIVLVDLLLAIIFEFSYTRRTFVKASLISDWCLLRLIIARSDRHVVVLLDLVVLRAVHMLAVARS